MNSLRNQWMKMSLYKKIALFVAGVIAVMVLSVVFTMQVMNYSLGKFDSILTDNSRCYNLYRAMETEISAFETHMLAPAEGTKQKVMEACVDTEFCLEQLPMEYKKIKEERYGRTWNLINGYAGYREHRDAVLEMDPEKEAYVTELYKVYEMQEMLLKYALRLEQETLKAGNDEYMERADMFRYIHWLIAASAVVMGVVLFMLARLFARTLIYPLIEMAKNSRKLAENDFAVEELYVENQDELGELVHAFNYMVRATRNSISLLEEKNRVEELLHKKEVEKIDMMRRMDAAQLELLKSQVNPHFLFNTLSMISGMAKLEEARVTEKMIENLSNLFRYNLRTKAQIVPICKELQVIESYMYIQQMRFEPRIQYRLIQEADPEAVMIPAFTLQPLVENAVIHGLSRKEEGGRLTIHIWEKQGTAWITVADTGRGMSREQLEEVRKRLEAGEMAARGIGLGNIYERMKKLYPDGSCRIYSRENAGTVVKLEIPQLSADKGKEMVEKGYV
ncbi:MAG: histidine kinase [Eubacteriales bacterium]|nr:histidine kinase [Eubacteriales bacterium]